MKLLFCHDGPIEKTRDNVYYSVGFNDDMLKKYEIISDDITLAMRVHDADVDSDGIDETQKLSAKHKVVKCPNIASAKGLMVGRRNCSKILEKAINKSDAVIIRLPSLVGNIAIDVCRKLNKPYLIELVGCPWDSLRSRSFVGKLIAPIVYLKTKIRVKKSPFVIYVTREFLQRRYPTNGRSISCSDVSLPNKVFSEIKQKKINPENIITMGTIGKLDIKYKGQQYVIKAMRELKKSGLLVKYSLVGPGDPDYLKKIARKYDVDDSVEFCGELSHEKIFEWLNSIDIYIQPSTTEGMPRSLIEAMSMGCVCLASDVGGMPELLDNEYVFKKKNVKKITKSLKQIIYDDLEQKMINDRDRTREFSVDILEEKRNSFLRLFMKEVKNV